MSEEAQAPGQVVRVRRSKRTKRRRRRRLIAAAVVAALIVGIGGGALLAYTSLKRQAADLQSSLTVDLKAGQSELEAGKASLSQATNARDLTLVTQATNHFIAAEGQFRAASDLADASLALRAAEGLPFIGSIAHSQHVAVTGIANMGVAIAQTGQDLAALDRTIIKLPAAGQSGRTVLTVLTEIQPSLAKVRDDLIRAQTAAADVDIHALPGSQQAAFTKAKDTINAGLSGLDEFDRLVPVLTEVLGGNGPRTYLIEQLNPAELRAGGGFIGTYSLLRADRGTLRLLSSGDAYDLANPRPLPGQKGFIPMPFPLRDIIPKTSWSFVDSNIYPDFASNAKAALQFAQPRISAKLNGVIAIDYYSVAKMLELTGPIPVPGYHTTISATTFVSQIVKADVTSGTHKALLAAAAGPLMQRVSSLPPSKFPALVADLNGLAAERHVQAYFTSQTVQLEIDRVGWSGTVNPTGSQDFMMEVEGNYFGDKVNYFLQRHYTVTLTREGGTLHHQVTIDLVNNTKCGSYVRTVYKVNTRLFVGPEASFVSTNLLPSKYANPEPPAGVNMFDGWLVPDVPCSAGRGQEVFKYDTAWPSGGLNTYELYWQKQPGTIDDQITVIWNDGMGHSYATAGSLTQDQAIGLLPTGITLKAGQPAQATVPSLSLG